MSDLLQSGQIFAERYRIDRFLAQGGFGAVYAAEQLATELRVALKVLWPQILTSADAVEKFKLEARVAGRINSDNIVRVIDAGFDAATQMPYLVMELLEGEDLDRLVQKNGPLTRERVIGYLRQVASALDRAHSYVDRDGASRAIIHRDLKPENLFLTHREDGHAVVKVLDFGIAKVLGGQTAVSREVKGTPLYMAFEQAAGQPIAPGTDIWALGLIAFYLLTGLSYWRAAFNQESTLSALFGEVLSLPIAAPSDRLREFESQLSFGPGFDAWFLRCVNRDISLRYRTAGEAVRELAVALGFPAQATTQRGGHGIDPANPDAPSDLHTMAGTGSPGPSQEAGAPIQKTQSALSSSGQSAPVASRRSEAAIAFGLIGLLVFVAGGFFVWRTFGGGSVVHAAAEPVAAPSGIVAVAPAPPTVVPPPPAVAPSASPEPPSLPEEAAAMPSAAPKTVPRALPRPSAPHAPQPSKPAKGGGVNLYLER